MKIVQKDLQTAFFFCPLSKLHICKCRLNDKKLIYLPINLADLYTDK